jgi:plastocyanin
VISGPGAANYGYLTPVATTSVGGALSYTNEDVARHDVIADDRGSDGQPLFSSVLAGLNETVPVTGTDRLQSGKQYAFHCSIHPGMHGTLIVQ